MRSGRILKEKGSKKVLTLNLKASNIVFAVKKVVLIIFACKQRKIDRKNKSLIDKICKR